MTGYPKNVELAITGFSSFEEAKNLADKYDKTVTLLTRHDGWNIWYNSSKELLEAPHLEAADIGYCQEITNADYEGDLIDSLRCTIDGLDSLDAIACAAGFYANIYDMAQKLDENETIYFNRDGGELTDYICLDKYPTAWTYDSRHYTVAVF